MKRTMLITGADGLLGREISLLFSRDFDVRATGRAQCDVTSPEAVRREIARCDPEVVVHCAAYTAVDRAEREREAAFAVNEGGTRNVARASREHGALLIAFGTDYIFDGSAGRPYVEEDAPRPLSAYGESKLAAERALEEEAPEHLLVRTQWLFGPHGPNFVFSILDRAARIGALRVVTDQVGCPTHARDLAEAVRRLLDAGARGTFHFSNAGETNFFDYAGFIIAEAGMERVRLDPVTRAGLPRDGHPALRPAYSALSKEKYARRVGRAPRRWEEAVREFLAEARGGFSPDP
jgi:dTDP-4-dehydrorhamnose reductase